MLLQGQDNVSHWSASKLSLSPRLDQVFCDEQVWVTELSAVVLQPLLYGWVTSSASVSQGKGLGEQGGLKLSFIHFVGAAYVQYLKSIASQSELHLK